MKPDDFEQRLQRVPLRPPSAAWRADILAAARAAAREMPVAEDAGFWWQVWREVFVKARHVWSGMAAVWLVILLVNWSLREPESGPVRAQLTEQDIQVAQKIQREIMVSLMEPVPGEPKSPAWWLLPRSEVPEEKRRADLALTVSGTA